MDWQQLSTEISSAIGQPFKIVDHNMIGGGSINSAYRIASDENSYFVKFNTSNKLSMFEAEADGLAELKNANAIRVPNVICTGCIGSSSYLVLENLHLSSHGNMQTFAEQLTCLHKQTHTQFGWTRDNTIGSTLQKNNQTEDWLNFWREQRLGFQLNLAKENGASRSLLDKGERLQAELSCFFTSYSPKPSLLHGDLWSGNYAFSESGEPVIFDPATYYGDREADIAMTELFGGFSQDFYQHYQSIWPLDDGYSVRKNLYNLYHILNHYNLFGGGYESQSNGMVSSLLANI